MVESFIGYEKTKIKVFIYKKFKCNVVGVEIFIKVLNYKLSSAKNMFV